MTQPKHDQIAGKVLTHLEGWGFPVEVQRRLGAFGIVWTIFETSLESTLWALTSEDVKGKRPSTDKTSVSDWIKQLGRPSPRLPPETHPVLAEASIAARDLMEYRHALAHGWLIPSATSALYIRNPGWNGEQRARPSHDAHVDENLLDMALAAGWALCQVVGLAGMACAENADPAKARQLSAMLTTIQQARSLANEVRHLTEMANSEKY